MSIEDRFMFISKLNEQISALIQSIPDGFEDIEESYVGEEIDALREQRQNLLDSLDWA